MAYGVLHDKWQCCTVDKVPSRLICTYFFVSLQEPYIILKPLFNFSFWNLSWPHFSQLVWQRFCNKMWFYKAPIPTFLSRKFLLCCGVALSLGVTYMYDSYSSNWPQMKRPNGINTEGPRPRVYPSKMGHLGTCHGQNDGWNNTNNRSIILINILSSRIRLAINKIVRLDCVVVGSRCHR